MSFDILFQPCRYTYKPVETKNPFKGKAHTVFPRSEPLTPEEVSAVEHVLKRANARGPDQHGCYVIDFPDGGDAEVYADDLSNSCMVSVRGVTSDPLRFLTDLLKAGNWIMMPAMEDGTAIAYSPACLKGIPQGFAEIVVCNSSEELGLLLSKGVRAWEKYRDQIVSDHG